MVSRIVQLIGGSALIALGIVFTVQANWGPSPWDIFHLAMVQHLGFSLGVVSVLTSLVVISTTLLLGGRWSVRWGTLGNTFVIGISIELFMTYVVPVAASLAGRLAYVGVGTFFMACGAVIYTRAGLGAGARDGLTLVLSQRLPFTVGRVRLMLEAAIAAVGWLLGGPVGPATIAIVFGTGIIADALYGIVGRGRLPASVRIPERKSPREDMSTKSV